VVGCYVFFDVMLLLWYVLVCAGVVALFLCLLLPVLFFLYMLVCGRAGRWCVGHGVCWGVGVKKDRITIH